VTHAVGKPQHSLLGPESAQQPVPAHRGEAVHVCKDGDSWRRGRGDEMIARPSSLADGGRAACRATAD